MGVHEPPPQIRTLPTLPIRLLSGVTRQAASADRDDRRGQEATIPTSPIDGSR